MLSEQTEVPKRLEDMSKEELEFKKFVEGLTLLGNLFGFEGYPNPNHRIETDEDREWKSMQEERNSNPYHGTVFWPG